MGEAIAACIPRIFWGRGEERETHLFYAKPVLFGLASVWPID